MIDVAKLHEQLDRALHKPPWCVYPPNDSWGKGIGAATTKYTIGGFEFAEDDKLAVAAVNALPALLEVYEAACAWSEGSSPANGTTRRLRAAIDAARSAA